MKQISSKSIGWKGTYNGRVLPAYDYWFTFDNVEPNYLKTKQFKAHFSLKR
jgi:gliding motility-associated-like protein